ncbi:MAG: flagellar hook-basal body complex protein FliE [Clostridiales bacterium]|nr:flagellar hook-basal body complex protein FliE [Clostridiales bacterium]
MQVNKYSKIGNFEINNDLGLFEKPKNKIDTSFSGFLSDAIKNVNKLENVAQEYSIQLASGELENIHEAMIASQKAEISLQYILEIRNKVLDAYREIMRMQI